MAWIKPDLYGRKNVIISVKAFAGFREVMPKEVLSEIPDGSTIGTLLKVLGGMFPGLEAMIFSSPGVLFEQANILENGRNIRFLNDLDTILHDGDIVAIFPPAGGG